MTRMAGGPLETASDVAGRLGAVVADPQTHIVVMSAAICDFRGDVLGLPAPSGPRAAPRLSSATWPQLQLTPVEKILDAVRAERKDIFLIGFKTTTGASEEDQFAAALALVKRASCNLVLANDLHNGRHMIVTPEQSRYAVGQDRAGTLLELVEMTASRSAGQFVRTTVVPGDLVAWDDPLVPPALRAVVDFCRAAGAFQPFAGKTVGHFGCRLGTDKFLFSQRKVDFNVEKALVRCYADAGEKLLAVGAKPSAGAATQRELFADHPGYDCVVHFHCPLREGVEMSTRPQRGLECGSKDCGQNTSAGMAAVAPGIKAVYLDQHGPNILFRGDADPAPLLDFLRRHFDLAATTRSSTLGSPVETD